MKSIWTGIFVLAIGLLAALPATGQFLGDELSKDDYYEEVLLNAEIVDHSQMSESEGVTRPYKLTLKNNDETEYFAVWKNPSGRVRGFWEGWKYEIAAYRLDRYLDLNMVPPTVERRFNNNAGSVQLWVDFWINMRDMASDQIKPPPDKSYNWNNKVYLQRAFDNLIANEDRHLGNILLTEDWRMILIDHSRAFRSSKRHTKKLMFDEKHREGPKIMKRLPRSFVEKIETLTPEILTEMMGEYLTEAEVTAIVARRDLILAEVQKQVKKNGEGKVLY